MCSFGLRFQFSIAILLQLNELNSKTMQAALQPQLIEKETIQDLSFNGNPSVNQHPNLMHQIKNATRLGNAYHSKVSIYFEDDNGPKRVDTTIWAHGARFICLKGGVWLPIANIIEIKS